MKVIRPKHPHYLRVMPDAAPAPARSPEPRAPLPPRMPKRSSAAVRKSLRTALDGAQAMREQVGDAHARFPHRADKAAKALATYAEKLTALGAELKEALRRERQRDLWRKGKPYAE